MAQILYSVLFSVLGRPPNSSELIYWGLFLGLLVGIVIVGITYWIQHNEKRDLLKRTTYAESEAYNWLNTLCTRYRQIIETSHGRIFAPAEIEDIEQEIAVIAKQRKYFKGRIMGEQ